MSAPQCNADRKPLLSFESLPTSEEELLAQAWPDLEKIARAWSPIGRRVVDVDDLTQAAATGLLRAFRTFDRRRGVPLRRYAGGFIKEEMARQLKLLAPSEPIETVNAQAKLERVRLEAVVRDSEQALAADIVTEAFTVLTRAQRRVVTLRYFDELKTLEIARELRRNPDTVRQMLQRGYDRLALFISTSAYVA